MRMDRMRTILTVTALLVASLCHAQTTIEPGRKTSKTEIDGAKAKLDQAQAENQPVRLQVGGYALAKIDLSKKMKSYIVPGSADCLQQDDMPKGTKYRGFLFSNDDSVWKYRTIEADKENDRVRISATSPGTATVIWFADVNGQAEVVSAYQFIVEGEVPGPVNPPTPTSDLTKRLKAAYELDKVSGVGPAEMLSKLANVYLVLSADDLSSIVNIADLSKFQAKSVLNAGIPDYKKTLTQTRLAIQQVILERMGIKDDVAYDSRPYDKGQARAIFKDIADSLRLIQ